MHAMQGQAILHCCGARALMHPQESKAMQFDDLKGKAVLVTGASRGIGAAVARGFAANGSNVAIHYRSGRAEAETLASELRRAHGVKAVALHGDFTQAAAPAQLVNAAARELGRLDVLVNNAGDVIGRWAITDFPEEALEQLYALNIRAVVMASRAAVPHLRARGGGAIIATSSISGRSGGGSGAILYAGTKGFVNAFTRGLAKELAPDNIRVNAVAPGVIMTDLQTRVTPQESIDASAAQTPQRRNGTSEECIGAFLYLASAEASSFVTGQVIEVNGGLLMP
jgi:3-oxoacyl-[acyl-carrier protein] reductase